AGEKRRLDLRRVSARAHLQRGPRGDHPDLDAQGPRRRGREGAQRDQPQVLSARPDGSLEDRGMKTEASPAHWPGVIERYRAFLPVSSKTPVITLHEGNTDLICARHLPERLGVDVKVYYKFEGLNPTGSFKDRGMTVAVSKAVEAGAKAILCASTGNTSASAAAYAARAGIACGVLIPEGKIALGKLAQALVHGARVIQI